MRWDVGAVQGAYVGEIAPAEGAPGRYTLANTASGWALCTAEGGSCWSVEQARSGSLQGGRAFIDGYGEHVQLVVVREDGGEALRFEGRRAACSGEVLR